MTHNDFTDQDAANVGVAVTHAFREWGPRICRVMRGLWTVVWWGGSALMAWHHQEILQLLGIKP